MNSRIGINKFMNMGKEAKFVIFAGAALLTAMLLPLIEVYWWGVTLSVSAVVAMLMALYRVRLWVRLLTMPFVLIGVIAATTCAYVVIRGGDTGSADADVDATIFSSRLLARCPLVGSVTQTEEGREAKALFERDGDRLDDMRILPWRSYPDRHRRREMLARLGAEFGMIVPLMIIGLHVLLAVWGIKITWKLKKGSYRTAAGWVLAILILPWINTLIGSGPTDPNEDPFFVVPVYLPFINEMPELLLASVIQLGVFIAAVRHGWCRQERLPGFDIIICVIKRRKMKKLLIFAAIVPWCSFAQSEMALAKVPKCEAWKLSKVEVRLDVDKEWHEAGDGTWYTNSVGEKISVERYCAAVNCTEEREVKPLLDKYYSRCQPNAIRKMYESDDERKDGSFWENHFTCDKSGKILAGSAESQDELTAWRIAENICLVHSADDSGRMKIRMYTFVLFDGKTRRTIAEFDYLPDPDAMNAILSVWTVPDAVNNVAAMYYNNKAWTHSVDDDYVVRLLTMAAQFGSATACENLAKLGRDRSWAKARVERWLRFAEACRKTIEAGYAPKMELKGISDWPISWIGE